MIAVYNENTIEEKKESYVRHPITSMNVSLNWIVI
jgi:hypothetical protein